MPAQKARVGSVVVLLSNQWDAPMFGAPLAFGQLGEVTRIEPYPVEFRYDVTFGERSLPLNRREFRVIGALVTT